MDSETPDFDYDTLFNFNFDDAALARLAEIEEEAYASKLVNGPQAISATRCEEANHAPAAGSADQLAGPGRTSPITLTPPVPTTKRGRGRPKGSKNKKKRGFSGSGSGTYEEDPVLSRKGPGRPRGSGHQQAQASHLQSVGPKTFPSAITVDQGKLVVPRTFPTTKPGPLPIADNSVTQSSMSNSNRLPEHERNTESATFVTGTTETSKMSPLSTTLAIPSAESSSGSLPAAPRYQPQTISVIPSDDPELPVDSGWNEDEDVYEGLLFDGYDDDCDSEEDDDDDDEDDINSDNSNTLPTPHCNTKCSALPSWLHNAFMEKLNESRKRGDDQLPPLYRINQSFWFPQPAPFFLLKRSNVTPQLLFNPRFFLWDPLPLCPEGIKCPNCSNKLHRHREIDRPRRCVDINSIFWMIGYRYRCPNCKNPKSQKKTVTFRSWDSRILSTLPRALQLEFPAILTRRSALSKPAFTMMRCCIQNGMGTKQFSTSLRMHHLERYDELHLQYLHTIAQRRLAIWRGVTAVNFPEFFDKSEKGFHGFIPSSSWLRNMYDNFIKEHQQDINQHMSLLSADVCAIDHSHKITKHIARINGVQVFTGLLTLTNDFGEIRVCTLVATKSHEQFRAALENMKTSLVTYGHKPPSLFYTDNIADKQFLEEVFPSLREDVTPVEKHAHLPIFTIPESPEVLIHVKQTTAAIDQAARTILDTIPMVDGGLSGQIVVGFDIEWNAEVQPYGGVVRERTAAVVQIACGNVIYILQVGDLLAAKQLPYQLRLLLASPSVIKVGCGVIADLRSLEVASGSKTPFVGGLELGKFAKERNLVSSARVSLSDLCAVTLQKCLRKNLPERISNHWQDDILSNDQINYAARDAYASLAIYNALVNIPTPHPLSDILTPQTPVFLYHRDNTRIIAHGKLSTRLGQTTHDGINITSKRTIVTITKVLIPGAIVNFYKKSLQEFGQPNFDLVVLRSHLRIAPLSQEFLALPPLAPLAPVLPPASSSATVEVEKADENGAASIQLCSISDDSEESFGQLLLYGSQTESSIAEPFPRLDQYISDPVSAAQGQHILKPVPADWPDFLRSRVLKDPFHVFNMFYIPRTHGLRATFARALRDAIFIPNKEDIMRIDQWGMTQDPPVTYEKLKVTSPKFIHRHCRRTIPPPEILYPLVHSVFQTFGHLQDAKTRQPLFNENSWKVANNVLSLIRNGYVSDPPGIPLYSQIGIDCKAGNLPVYRCFRGTNFTEGGVHTQLRPRLPTSGASVRHVYSCLLDFILRHNLLVGTHNRTGQVYKGHTSIWLTNEIQECLISLHDTVQEVPQLVGWINGNFYESTSEVAGILPIPSGVQESCGIATYLPTHDAKQPNAFLASMQQTRKPVVPIHSPAERDLFRKLLREDPTFNDSRTGPQWKRAIKVWNRKAEEQSDITYKLIEHLTSYFTEWNNSLNVKESLTMSTTERKTLRDYIRGHQLDQRAPTVPPTTLVPRTITHGFCSPDSPVDLTHPLSNASENTRNEMPAAVATALRAQATSNPTTSDATQGTLSSKSAHCDPGPSSIHEVMVQLSRKRVAESLENSKPVKKVRIRHCAKCGRRECRGNQRAHWCSNACQDCGKSSCRGRNSKKPQMRCDQGWD